MELLRSSEATFLLRLLFFFLHILLMISACDGREVLCHAEEREALLQFKDGFSRAKMISSWGGEDCCSWKGIRCDNRTGHVVQLNLQGEPYGVPSLRGKINPSLAVLMYLRRLDLSGNNFEGRSIPPFLGSFQMLTYLNLSLADFSGVVPPHLGNLSSLQVLDLSYDDRVESNGEWLSQLRQLRYLDLSYTNLTRANNLFEVLNRMPFLETLHLYNWPDNFTQSSLRAVNFTRLSEFSIYGDRFLNPCWLFNITSLEYLHLDFYYLWLDDCQNAFAAKLCKLKSLTLWSWSWPIRGDLTRFFMECNQRLALVSLDLSHNSFTGQLPSWLGEYKSLETLDMSGNNLSGSVPESIGAIASLKKFSLYRNNLMGSIPRSICGLQSLEYLDLSSSNLMGSIPQSIGRLLSLKHLDFSSNNLMGSIPQSIGRLQSLEYLDFSGNSLTGSIPQSIGRLQSLKYLYFSGNNLMGSIPQSIGRLQSLKHLNFSNNNLMGSIPESIGTLQSLEYLCLRFNNLSGPLPSSLWKLKSLHHLDLSSNYLQGNLTEEHFVHLSNLTTLVLSSNSFQVTLSPHWIPPFNLRSLRLRSCKLGPYFPSWLRTQNNLLVLDLSDSNISDVIPQWIWNFSSIILYLNLSKNKLKGVVPAAMYSSRMSVIILHSNLLEGSLSSFPRAYTLLLSRNLFSGPININVTSMIRLSLSRNNFSGNVPPSLCEAELLNYLDLSYNNLSGQLPSCLGSPYPNNIESLHLNNNDLNGTLPAWLGNNNRMQLLDIGENNFSGEFPDWISNSMLQLKILRLRSNSFYGSIPLDLSNLTSLQVLDLADNGFSGSILPTIGNFSAMKIPQSGVDSLGIFSTGYYTESIMVTTKGRDDIYERTLILYTSIDLSGNKLSGEVPGEVGRLVYLRNLNLSHNYLSGHIPETFSNLSQLESLDLSSNSLSGGIPETLSGLTSLSSFNVSFNKLSGRIPSGGQFNTFTNYSYMGNLDLCGRPLQFCQTDLSPPIEGYIMQIDEKDQDHYFVWLCLSIVLGFITGFWTFLGTLILKRNWRYSYFQFVDEQCEKYYMLAKIYAEKCKRMCLKS